MTVTDLEKLVKYWLDLSERDWKAMKSLVRGKNNAQALFFLHLSIEKLLKALIVIESKDHAPHSHNLPYLFGKSGLEFSEQWLEDLKAISEFNMSSRYPDENLEFYKRATDAYVKHWVAKGGSIRLWLKRQLKKK